MWLVFTLQERQEAGKLFATENGEPSKTPAPAKTFVPGEIPLDEQPEAVPMKVEEPSRKGPTPEQIIAIKVSPALKTSVWCNIPRLVDVLFLNCLLSSLISAAYYISKGRNSYFTYT